MVKESLKAKQKAHERAREVANAIIEFTGSVQGYRFTVTDIAKKMGVDTDYIRMFLHKYDDEKTNVTYLLRYAALNRIIPYYVADSNGKRIVYAYGVKPRKPDETFTLTPVKTEPAKKEPLKQPLADTKIVKIEYARKTSPVEKEKTVEEYLAEIKNEIAVQNAVLRDLYNIQRDTYNLFKEIKDGKKK